MKHKHYFLLWVILIPLLGFACNQVGGGDQPPSNAIIVNTAANTSLTSWLEGAIKDFNASKVKTSAGDPVYVTLQPIEAGQAVVNIASGEIAPVLWIPDDNVWTDVLATKGKADFQSDCVSVARSPLVIAVWRPIAESLGWPGRSLGWLDFGSLAADQSAWAYYGGGQFGKEFRLSHTHPGLSATGANTLLAVVQAALSKTESVTVGEIQQPIVQSSVGAFEAAISSFGTTTDSLGRAMRERGINYLGAAVVYESAVVQYGQGDPQIVPIYPYEGTFIATHPACINATKTAGEQEAARLFRDYLIGESAQNAAVANGLRPVNSSVSMVAPMDDAHGVNLAQPEIVFDAPSVDSIFAVQTLWQSSRKNVNLAMVLDTSGSMSGDKIVGVKKAAIQFVEQMGDEDYLSLIVFENNAVVRLEHVKVGTDRDRIVAEINALSASGSTPLYDAIADSAAIISRTLSDKTTNAIIVLTDGLDTSSERYAFGSDLISLASANGTTVFTIAYGDDADERMLADLAQNANGNFYLGTNANIAAIYEEMSAAFGGSVGIGR